MECVSNSSQTGVGTITTPDGDTLQSVHDGGGWRVISPSNRPAVIRLLRSPPSSLPTSAQGIYTCTIPDSTGQDIHLNVGLYPPGFNGNVCLGDCCRELFVMYFRLCACI